MSLLTCLFCCVVLPISCLSPIPEGGVVSPVEEANTLSLPSCAQEDSACLERLERAGSSAFLTSVAEEKQYQELRIVFKGLAAFFGGVLFFIWVGFMEARVDSLKEEQQQQALAKECWASQLRTPSSCCLRCYLTLRRAAKKDLEEVDIELIALEGSATSYYTLHHMGLAPKNPGRAFMRRTYFLRHEKLGSIFTYPTPSQKLRQKQALWLLQLKQCITMIREGGPAAFRKSRLFVKYPKSRLPLFRLLWETLAYQGVAAYKEKVDELLQPAAPLYP